MCANAPGTLLIRLQKITRSTIAAGLLMLLPLLSMTQDSLNVQDSNTHAAQKKRQLFVAGITGAGYTGTLLALNNAWYRNEARSAFHTFNDAREWLQVDKAGHAWTAYNTGRALTSLWTWTGMEKKKAVWVGGLSGFAFLTGIEFLDAYSAKWGWSWSDIAANVSGSGLFMTQELLWNEQRVQLKFSFHRNNYPDAVLDRRADDLFGSSWYERMLKDYNAQTYWLSVNVRSFFPSSNWPAWLNIATGYGAGGMYGGFENVWTDPVAGPVERNDIPRVRQFYLAPDIDLTRIPTRSRFLRTAFSMINCLKFPAPALRVDSKGKWKVHALYF